MYPDKNKLTYLESYRCRGWARKDTEKGYLFVGHLKKVCTDIVSTDIMELPPFVHSAKISIK